MSGKEIMDSCTEFDKNPVVYGLTFKKSTEKKLLNYTEKVPYYIKDCYGGNIPRTETVNKSRTVTEIVYTANVDDLSIQVFLKHGMIDNNIPTFSWRLTCKQLNIDNERINTFNSNISAEKACQEAVIYCARYLSHKKNYYDKLFNAIKHN